MSNFVDAMLGDSRGVVLAINILDSISEGLLDEALVGAFLRECVGKLSTTGVLAFLDVYSVVTDIAQQSFHGGTSNVYMLAGKKGVDIRLTPTTTAQRSSRLYKHVLSDRGRMIVPIAPRFGRAGDDRYRALMRRLGNEPDWLNATGTLGLDNGRIVILMWVAPSDSLPPGGDTAPSNEWATALRDWLGLSHVRVPEHLITVSIDASRMAPGSLRSRRPTFADGGNDRFRIRPDGAGHDENWGMTVNLRVLDDNSRNHTVNINGAPEQVCAPIALRGDVSLEFDYAGRVQNSHRTSDDEFAQMLLKKSGHTHSSLRAGLLRMLSTT